MPLCIACIIPDRDIRLEVDEPANRSAVRIVEPSPITPEMLEICLRDPEGDPKPDPTFCPQVPSSRVRGGVLGRNLCTCPARQADGNAIDWFEIYAEDGDLASEDAGALYGAFLLDADPASSSPDAAVAYLGYWNPARAARLVDTDVVSVGREQVPHWVFRIRNGHRQRVDLCNDSGKTLAPGLHSLQFMVTDLPFFTPQELDDDGNPLMGKDGKPLYGNPQYGVPDLAAGATYDTMSFVFECLPQDDSRCNCEEDSL